MMKSYAFLEPYSFTLLKSIVHWLWQKPLPSLLSVLKLWGLV
jgi:hypothetical protein